MITELNNRESTIAKLQHLSLKILEKVMDEIDAYQAESGGSIPKDLIAAYKTAYTAANGLNSISIMINLQEALRTCTRHNILTFETEAEVAEFRQQLLMHQQNREFFKGNQN